MSSIAVTDEATANATAKCAIGIPNSIAAPPGLCYRLALHLLNFDIADVLHGDMVVLDLDRASIGQI